MVNISFASKDSESIVCLSNATFVFHNLDQPLLSREAYQQVWDGWRRDDGFEVLSCRSSNAFVSLQGEVAIFIHDVATELRLQGELYCSQERETIVFRRSSPQEDHPTGRWLACHEHLSVSPPTLPSP